MHPLNTLLTGIERALGHALVPLIHLRHQRALTAPAGQPAESIGLTANDSETSAWSGQGPPVRQRNLVTPLIDGEDFFTHLYDAVLAAQDYVFVTSWCLTPHIPLRRETSDALVQTRLVSVLSEAAKRVPVRVLLWAGAPALLQPTSHTVRETAGTIEQEGSGDLVCALDKTAKVSHSHHQKAVVIDGQVAFVGGTDLTTSAGDRWDGRQHLLRSGVNWHDATLMLQGEAVADVEANFRQRWQEARGKGSLPAQAEPRVDASWQTPVQVIRTIPTGTYASAPEGEFGIREAYLSLIHQARSLIYLESQYLWSPKIMDALIEAIRRPRSTPFRVVIVLPARATSGKWDNDKHVDLLRKADGGRGIAEVYSLFTSGPTTGERPFRYRPVYVHAKLGVVDDEWLILGSANLNNRGLESDSEIDLLVRDPQLARALRLDLWSEHLGIAAEHLAGMDTVQLTDTLWHQRAVDNERRMAQGALPLESSVHLYRPGRVPGSWLIDETQELTFEH